MAPIVRRTGLLVAVLVLATALRIIGITTVPEPLWDEGENRAAAINYAEEGFPGPGNWYQPYLSNLVLYASMGIFGDTPIGWRMPGTLFGILSVYLVYRLALQLFRSESIALLAGLLLAIDPLHISLSRMAKEETLSEALIILCLYFALRYRERLLPRYVVLSGLMLGLGAAVKWYAVFIIPVIAAICFGTLLQRGEDAGERFRRALLVVSSLLLLPATAYLMAFYPWFGRGYTLSDFIWLQEDMYLLQNAIAKELFVNMTWLSGRASEWFTMPQISGLEVPIPQVMVGILYMGNPFVWRLVLPAIAYAGYRLVKWRSFAAGAVMSLFGAQYLPLLIIRRPIFVHSAMSVLPVAVIAISSALDNMFNRPGRTWVLYTFLICNAFAVFTVYPFLIGYPLTRETFNTYYYWLGPYLYHPK